MQPTLAAWARSGAAVLLTALLAACGDSPLTGPGEPPAPPEQAVDEPVDLPSYDPDTSVADYADGFPVDLLAAPDPAEVLASSAGVDDGVLQVSLQLATSLTADEAMEWYADRLESSGFSETTDLDVPGLAAQTVYTRPAEDGDVAETVVVGVLEEADRRLVTVSGTVAPDAD